MANAFAFTRSGGGATITRDCPGLAAFEREVARLHAELDDALARARERFGAPARAPAARAPEAAPPEEAASAPKPVRVDPALRVGDAMTREVVTVGPNDALAVADQLMKQGRFRHLVVVDEGRVVGVVSQRDLFYGTLAWSMGLGRRAHDRALDATPVKDVMRTDPATLDPDAPLA
ncbi:MAG: CBS domain-containing protein, partial [Myxococcota bacterium]|nr:CBS domain-containing protein [Myxococcota bacterium]